VLFVGTATASWADACLLDAVAATHVQQGLSGIDWEADPSAVAYCVGQDGRFEFCDTPSQDRRCGGKMFPNIVGGFGAYITMRVDELRLADGVMFGRVMVVNSCNAGERVPMYLAFKDVECAFRPQP
jgi:hypothetical protein